MKKEFSEEEFNLEEELRKDPELEFEDKEESPVWLWTKRSLGIILVLALFYLYGLNQFFQYRKTPEAARQPSVEVLVDAETITLPLNVFVIRGEGQYGSERDIENVSNLITNAEEIWKQAAITLDVENIYFVERSNEEIKSLYNNPRSFGEGLENFNPENINVVLVGNLGGINGVAFTGLNMVSVADYTTVPDFRALAHEIGHILGLPHVDDRSLLMYQGANNFDLTLEEIETARREAQKF